MNSASQLEIREFLVDSSALMYLHSHEVKEVLPLILYRVKFYVLTLSAYEFLTFIYLKFMRELKRSLLDTLSKLYEVISVDEQISEKASMIAADLLQHGVQVETVTVFNVAVALMKNLAILTEIPELYSPYSKYGVIVIDVKEFVKKFKETLREYITT